MTSLRCVNCLGLAFEQGDHGEPTRCAQCGGTMSPITIEQNIAEHLPRLSAAAARPYWAEMHLVVERAGDREIPIYMLSSSRLKMPSR